MASPHVAGAAALVWSRSDVITNSQVVDILLSSADAQGVSPVRLDSWTIHGGLNLHDAISYGLTNLPPQADAGADQTVADQDRDGVELVTLDGSGSSDRDGSIATYDWREGDTSIGSGAAPWSRFPSELTRSRWRSPTTVARPQPTPWSSPSPRPIRSA